MHIPSNLELIMILERTAIRMVPCPDIYLTNPFGRRRVSTIGFLTPYTTPPGPLQPAPLLPRNLAPYSSLIANLFYLIVIVQIVQ